MKAAVLRPEPGNAATVARLGARGIATLRLPLFAVAPIAWTPPDPAAYDALLLTSANAVRQGGEGLERLAALPVVAVGEATADAARAASLNVAATGIGDATAAVEAAQAAGFARLLHLAGRERIADLPVAATIVVYASTALDPPRDALAGLAGSVALLHSPRAARRLGELLDGNGIARAAITVAALSGAIVAAAGDGWHDIAAAAEPTDDALVTLAAALVGNR